MDQKMTNLLDDFNMYKFANLKPDNSEEIGEVAAAILVLADKIQELTEAVLAV